MSGAMAVQNLGEGQRAKVVATDASLHNADLPSLDEIRSGGTFDRAKRLDDASLAEAMEGAKGLDIEDDNTLVSFGIEEQREASQLAEKTVEYSRKNDFTAIREATEGMNEKMRQLNMGNLKPSIWDKILPGKAAKRINSVLKEHKDISEGVRESIEALAGEKQKLMEYRAAAELDIEASEGLIKRFDIKIAQLEIQRDAFNKRVGRFIEEHQNSQDESVTQTLKQFETIRGLMERKLNALVNSRADQFTTLENLRNFQTTYNVLIQAAEDQANFNKQAWNNTVSVLTHSARQKGVQNAIDSQREAAGQWMKARGDAAVKTVEDTMRTLQTGVIDLSRALESIDKAEEANLKLIQGCKQAQSILSNASSQIAERSAKASERTAAAARASEEEVAGMVDEFSKLSGPPRAA